MSKVFLQLVYIPLFIFFFITSYILIQKPVLAANTSMCCPPGYDTGWASHPAFADTKKTCWKRVSVFTYLIAKYEKTDKIPCGTASSTMVTGQAPAGTCKPGDPNCNSAAGLPCTTNNKPGIETVLGCIPTDPTALIQSLLKFSIGIGGGIALLLMIAGAFQMMTSAGNPEALKKGTAQMTSAVIGLLFIIFAVMLLQIIGVDILNLPGFGK